MPRGIPRDRQGPLTTCLVDGCSEPRYRTFNRCHEHMKAVWRDRSGAKDHRATPTGALWPVASPLRWCSVCNRPLPLSAFDTAKDKPQWGVYNFLCRAHDITAVVEAVTAPQPARRPTIQKQSVDQPARKAGRPPRVPRPETDDLAPPVKPLPIRPFSQRVAPALPAIADSGERVVIKARSSKRVEKKRQPDGNVQWVAIVDGVVVGGGSAPDNGLADREAWQWIGEHTEPEHGAGQKKPALELEAEKS